MAGVARGIGHAEQRGYCAVVASVANSTMLILISDIDLKEVTMDADLICKQSSLMLTRSLQGPEMVSLSQRE